jgi:1,2-diacylglycerol 3-beta-galactosyltransferase
MVPQTKDKKKIIFLFSDTGGGHRSSSEAIIEALELEYPQQFETEMVDIFRQYAPTPFQRAPELYPQMTRSPRMWKAGYRVSDGKRKSKFFTHIMWPYIRQSIKRLVDENPCDLFVSVHPFGNRTLLNITSERKIPLITVVTDMVSVHAFWFDPRADLIIVPTNAARQHGLKYGIPPEKIVTAGQPVAESFRHSRESKTALRKRLQWSCEIPVILLVGGGEGMGPLEKIAHAIDQAELPAELAVVTGRNKVLLTKMQQREWKINTHLYGFAKEMPDLMAAADILVTKAGPGTISEAFITGLPLVLYSRLPGQEDGNVRYVLDHQAGVWAPSEEEVLETLHTWLENPEALSRASAASRKLGKPEATRQIARLIAEKILQPDPTRSLAMPDRGPLLNR